MWPARSATAAAQRRQRCPTKLYRPPKRSTRQRRGHRHCAAARWPTAPCGVACRWPSTPSPVLVPHGRGYTGQHLVRAALSVLDLLPRNPSEPSVCSTCPSHRRWPDSARAGQRHLNRLRLFGVRPRSQRFPPRRSRPPPPQHRPRPQHLLPPPHQCLPPHQYPPLHQRLPPLRHPRPSHPSLPPHQCLHQRPTHPHRSPPPRRQPPPHRFLSLQPPLPPPHPRCGGRLPRHQQPSTSASPTVAANANLVGADVPAAFPEAAGSSPIVDSTRDRGTSSSPPAASGGIHRYAGKHRGNPSTHRCVIRVRCSQLVDDRPGLCRQLRPRRSARLVGSDLSNLFPSPNRPAAGPAILASAECWRCSLCSPAFLIQLRRSRRSPGRRKSPRRVPQLRHRSAGEDLSCCVR